jgi:hypothetical protein
MIQAMCFKLPKALPAATYVEFVADSTFRNLTRHIVQP